jgi:hypothetical protein
MFLLFRQPRNFDSNGTLNSYFLRWRELAARAKEKLYLISVTITKGDII